MSAPGDHQQPSERARTLAQFQRDEIEAHHPFAARPELNHRQERIVEFASAWTTADDTICDLGCQDGRILRSLDVKTRIGVDISEIALTAARQHGIETHRLDIDGEALPFPDESLATISCFDTLEHCPRTDHIMNEVNRVLRPSGRFLVSVPNINHPGALVYFLKDYPPPSAARYRSNHYRDFTHTTFRSVLQIHGFTIDASEGSYLAPFWNRLSIQLARRIPRLGETLLYAARKQDARVIPDGYVNSRRDLENFFRQDLARKNNKEDAHSRSPAPKP